MRINSKTKYLTQAGLIAAAYAALTYLSSLWGLAYGQVQLRISEALMVLPLFTQAAVPGLAAGCYISNLGSPLGPADVIIGTAATLLSALGTRWLGDLIRNGRGKKWLRYLAPLFGVVCNALLVGTEITILMPGSQISTDISLTAFAVSAGSIALGELLAGYALGIPLMLALERSTLFTR